MKNLVFGVVKIAFGFSMYGNILFVRPFVLSTPPRVGL